MLDTFYLCRGRQKLYFRANCNWRMLPLMEVMRPNRGLVRGALGSDLSGGDRDVRDAGGD